MTNIILAVILIPSILVALCLVVWIVVSLVRAPLTEERRGRLIMSLTQKADRHYRNGRNVEGDALMAEVERLLTEKEQHAHG